jgi:hypothetical protein
LIIERAKLQPITDSAWIVHGDQNKLGILNRDVQNHYTFVNGSVVLKFDDKKEVMRHFGNTHLFKEQITAEIIKPDASYINGYLVRHLNPVPVEADSELYNPNLPLYLKKQGSKSTWCAGYYCIKYPGLGWCFYFNIKEATLLNYPHEGPFRTQFEAKQRQRTLKTLDKKNEQ